MPSSTGTPENTYLSVTRTVEDRDGSEDEEALYILRKGMDSRPQYNYILRKVVG